MDLPINSPSNENRKGKCNDVNAETRATKMPPRGVIRAVWNGKNKWRICDHKVWFSIVLSGFLSYNLELKSISVLQNDVLPLSSCNWSRLRYLSPPCPKHERTKSNPCIIASKPLKEAAWKCFFNEVSGYVETFILFILFFQCSCSYFTVCAVTIEVGVAPFLEVECNL